MLYVGGLLMMMIVLGFGVQEGSCTVYEVRNSTALWDIVHGNKLVPGDEGKYHDLFII